MYSFLADLLVLLHVAFVAFVLLGGLLVLRWPKVAWVHVPAAIWGAAVEFAGWVCPLTPLEVRFRALAGEAGYQGGFVEHYLLPLLYPVGLSREVQFVLGGIVIGLNVAVYAWVAHRSRAATRRRRRRGPVA